MRRIPLRLCHRLSCAGAIVVNEKLAFATLKRSLPDVVEGAKAVTCTSHTNTDCSVIKHAKDWKAWLGAASLLVDVDDDQRSKSDDHQVRASEAAPAVAADTPGSLPAASARTVRVALHKVHGHDFGCVDSEGNDDSACQLPCHSSAAAQGDDEGCVAAYRRCLHHADCQVCPRRLLVLSRQVASSSPARLHGGLARLCSTCTQAIELNAPEYTWATLKKDVQNRSDAIAVDSAAAWAAAFHALQAANKGSEGVASTSRTQRAFRRRARGRRGRGAADLSIQMDDD